MFYKIPFVFFYITLFLTSITSSSSFKEINQELNEHLFKYNKNLITDISFKIDKNEVICSIKFSSDGLEDNCINYVYSYDRTNPEKIKISFNMEGDSQVEKKEEKLASILTAIPIKRNEEVKLVKDIDINLDNILSNLQPITFSNIRLNLTLNKNSEGLISGYVNSTSDEANISQIKAQDALKNSLLKSQPSSLEKLVFNLYIYALAISLVQHENLKVNPN